VTKTFKKAFFLNPEWGITGLIYAVE